MAKHARLSLSDSKRWITCSASIKLSEPLPPKPSNNNAKIGTIIHGAYERSMNGAALSFHPAEVNQLIKLGSNHKWAMDVLVNALEETNKVFDNLDIGRFGVELKVDPGKAWGRTDCWGTSDIVALSEDSAHLVVLDLKTGRIPVSARKNSQMMLYALGALPTVVDPSKVTNVTVGIVQPTIDRKASLWSLPIEELLQFSEVAKDAAYKTDIDGLEPTPDPSACEYCIVRPTCSAFFKKSLDVFDNI